MNNLDQITKELGTRYEVSKTAAAELASKKSEFFIAIDEEIVSTETLAQQTVSPPADFGEPSRRTRPTRSSFTSIMRTANSTDAMSLSRVLPWTTLVSKQKILISGNG